MSPLTRIVCQIVVFANEPRKRVLRGWKDAEGNAQFEEQDLGYFLMLRQVDETQPTLTIHTKNRLAFEPGDRILLSLERAP